MFWRILIFNIIIIIIKETIIKNPPFINAGIEKKFEEK